MNSSHAVISAESQIQAFKGRLVEMIDQAQHFATLGHGGPGGLLGSTAQAFREGLDNTERERKDIIPLIKFLPTEVPLVFSLAQESAKSTKRWYEESERARQ